MLKKDILRTKLIISSEEINLKDVFETKQKKKLLVGELGEIEFEIIYINSIVSYYMKKVTALEERLLEEERSLTTLDQTIKLMEGIHSL